MIDRNKSHNFYGGSWGIGEVRGIHFKLDKIGESCSMDYKNEEDPAN